MNVYTNSTVNVDMTNDVSETTYETLIYTETGIYKKYKKHFFLYETNKNAQEMSDGKNSFFVEPQGEDKLNKQRILTSIPYKCYFVNRTIKKKQLDDNVTCIEETDNGIFENIYFTVSDHEKIKYIRSYLK